MSNFSFPQINLPKFKTPHLEITYETSGLGADIGKFFGLPGKPKFGVNWYAQGGVFDSPTVIGVAENGREAVMPLEHNTGWIDELAGKINISAGNGNSGILHLTAYFGTEKIFDDAIDYINEKTRTNGKCVIKVGG